MTKESFAYGYLLVVVGLADPVLIDGVWRGEIEMLTRFPKELGNTKEKVRETIKKFKDEERRRQNIAVLEKIAQTQEPDFYDWEKAFEAMWNTWELNGMV
jgi:hypothetical protein